MVSLVQSRPVLLVALLSIATLAGCLGGDQGPPAPTVTPDPAPYLGYVPDEPDMGLVLEQLDMLLDAADGVQIHARIVKPEGEGPFPVITQFTPYTAPGENVIVNNLIEPAVGAGGAFVDEFVRRGYAFAFADVRGTGDSSGCMDLRGQGDIDDLAHLIETLGTQSWSNGNVGFIGASYPGSEAHMAGLAAAQYGVPHLKAVVPIVASTSFYHYHHNDGVPYAGQHSLGGTNTFYTNNAVSPTVNPHSPNYVTRYIEEATECETKEQVVNHGGLDQTGAYYAWWQERNLRPRANTTEVPVLMAQGLADWNVKPDHIATWFNDLEAPKTLIAGQWGHAYPRSASDDCDAFTDDPGEPYLVVSRTGGGICDPHVPYDQWWEYVTAFFDTNLKGIETGMFGTDVAWVQANDGSWHRSAAWPLLADEREEVVLHLSADGKLLDKVPAEAATASWAYCGRDQMNMGQAALANVESNTNPCYEEGRNTELVFVSEPFTERTVVSGVPLIDLALETSGDSTHLVAVIDIIGKDGKPVDHDVRYQDGGRQNYGYLNPVFRDGLLSPESIPDGVYNVTIDTYPQEDVIEPGERVRLTLRSIDGGRTIEAFGEGTNRLHIGPEDLNALTLPVRPASLQDLRLTESEATEAAVEGDQA